MRPVGCLPASYDTDQVRRALAHVRWIGGSPAAGKSTIAQGLARAFDVRVYEFDRRESAHVARRMANVADYPAYTSFLALTMDQRWVLRPPEEMAEQVIAMWTERFRLVVDDLRAMPATSPIVAEGPGLFPDCVHPVITGDDRAIWLVPTPTFCRTVRLERDVGSFEDTSDPARAMHNLIERDILLAAYVQRRAADLGLAVLEVDGTTPIAEMTTIIERRWGDLRMLTRAGDRQLDVASIPPKWDAYVGHYAYPGHVGHDVSVRDGALITTSRLTGRVYPLAHEVGHAFRVVDGPLAGEPVTFIMDVHGTALRLILAPEEFERQ